MKKALLAAALAATTLQSMPVAAQDEPSRYLRCDGEPNNMTAGESFARLIGAATLLGIFAPAPESPDPSAREFGEAGVAVCSSLIDGADGTGEDIESNPIRRIPLILARAAHQIEAQNYEAAIADVAIARNEAQAAGLLGNPYFDRSMGLSFSNIEAAAYLRMGDPAQAELTSLNGIAGMRYSFFPSIFSRSYSAFQRDLSPEMELKLHSSAQIMPLLFSSSYASELDEAGRFADGATQHEAVIYVLEGFNLELQPSQRYAQAAVSHALAGNWEMASMRADFARSNMAARSAQGEPEENSSSIVELLDFYSIIEQFQNGEEANARRMFAARSQWTTPSFGAVMAVTDMLREGASQEELFGSLTQSGDEMWQKRYDELLAVELQDDTENDDLFDLIVDYAKVDEFEDRAKNTHRVEKSKMMSDEPDEDGQYRIWATGSMYSAADSIMLHAALQARHRGKEGFTMHMILPQRSYRTLITAGFVRFVDRGENGTPPSLFIAADDVINELQPVIPTRDEVKQRRRERRNNR